MKRKPELTPEETANVRHGLRALRWVHGGWAAVARGLEVYPKTLERIMSGKAVVTARFVLRMSRFAETTFDDVIKGIYLPPGACPKCGFWDTELPVSRPK